jgi:hypothetical protein
MVDPLAQAETDFRIATRAKQMQEFGDGDPNSTTELTTAKYSELN